MIAPNALKQITIWQQDATELCRPVRWLPFWRPKVLAKRGYFSPWFWPPLWASKSGAFNLFFLLIVSEDLLDCAPIYRRAIIAHECGHLSGFHTLISMVAIALVLNNTFREALVAIAAHNGPWAAFGALLTLLVAIMGALGVLLHWFEHQADDYACARVGAVNMIATLVWLNERAFGANGSSWIGARIKRLRRIHPMQ